MHRIIKRGFKTAANHYQRLKISPTCSHTASKVDITGDGFQPDAPLTIQSSLTCPEERFNFHSYAHVFADENGCFDLSKSESISGTYTGVEEMGLFWSMEKQGKSYDIASLINGSRILPYKFNVYQGHEEDFASESMIVASGEITRYLVDDSVTRIMVSEGDIKGTLFIPKGDGPFPAVISLLGGVKMRQVPEQHAAYLASHGFVTLTLAFFGVEGLPRSYLEKPIDIEHFERGVEFLQNHPSVANENIGVLGESKGGEIALSMMTHLPQVKAVCTLNGSVASIAVSTVYKGQHEVEALSGNPMRAQFRDDGSVDISECLDDPKEQPKSIVQFEKSKADLLMIACRDDLNWKSEMMAEIAKDKMDRYGMTNYVIQNFLNVGHFIDPPNLPICTYDYHPIVPNKIKCFFGGSNKTLNSKEQVEVWQNVLGFFQQSLRKKDSAQSKL